MNELKKPIHRLSAKNYDTMTCTCSVCGPNAEFRIKGTRPNLTTIDACRDADRPWYGGYSKLAHCELCGIKPMFESSLDVQHVNGVHEDNSKGNHRTMCKVCHADTEQACRLIVGGRASVQVKQFIQGMRILGFISDNYFQVANIAK